MATEIEVTFAKSQTLPEPVPEGRLQLVDESASATEVEAYVGTQNGTKKITDKDKASIEALENGVIVPKLADNMTPYAEDSGTTQTQPFFLEGTATGNGESRVDAKQVPAYAFLQEKRGNMVCVNQLAGENLGGVSGLTITNNSGIYTINGTSSSAGHYLDFVFNCLSGHKYLVIATAKNYPDISDNTNPGIQLYGTDVIYAYVYVSDVVRNGPTFLLGTATGSGAAHFRFRTSSDVTYNNTNITPILVDLTQWFNGNIPAYLLSHPEAFGRYYKGSLAYEPGRLEPATGRYLTSVGRNIWDEEWEVGSLDNTTGEPVTDNSNIRAKNYCQCSSNTSYYFYSASGKTLRIYWYDSNKNIIDNYLVLDASSVSPDNAHYFKVRTTSSYGSTYNHDITISEYYSGESGYDKYYPHEVLATIDTGTESLYSAGSAYDSKVPSGLITRRIGSVDLGTLNWAEGSVTSRFYCYVTGAGATSDKQNAVCSKYLFKYENADDVAYFVGTSGQLVVNDYDYTDAASFKAAMSGVMLYYELAEPTTEQGTPFQENVPIDDFGQLSWSNTDVPQGNQIFYPVDYKAYLDTLMKRTDGDATSLARKTDYASYSTGGVVRVYPSGYNQGINISPSGLIFVQAAAANQIKDSSPTFNPIVTSTTHLSTFYGLSRAAGVNLASSTEETAPDGTNTGVYPAAAKSAIQNMLGITDLIGDINTVLDSVNGVVI